MGAGRAGPLLLAASGPYVSPLARGARASLARRVPACCLSTAFSAPAFLTGEVMLCVSCGFLEKLLPIVFLRGDLYPSRNGNPGHRTDAACRLPACF